MADWDTCGLDTGYDNTGHESLSSDHSRRSSMSSTVSNGNKENRMTSPKTTNHSYAPNITDSFGGKEIVLRDGPDLTGESVTENVYEECGKNDSETNGHLDIPEIPPRPVASYGTAKAKSAKSPYASSIIDSISEEEITIPNDGNIYAFTIDQIANFLRCMKVDPRIISHLHKKSVDGKRFSRLKDSELESLGMKNAVVKFFIEKSSVKTKKKSNWIL